MCANCNMKFYSSDHNVMFILLCMRLGFSLLRFLCALQVRYIGVSNETSYGVMEFVHAAKVEGLPKIVSIQNSYSLLVRCRFEGEIVTFAKGLYGFLTENI